MSLVAVLENQHLKVKGLFIGVSEAGAYAPALVMQLATVLTAHMIVEEEFLYPIIEVDEPSQIAVSREEHRLIAFGLTRLLLGDTRLDGFRLKVTAVSELFDCHSADEERNLFAGVTSAPGEPNNEALCRNIERRFRTLLVLGYYGCRLARGKTSDLLLSALS
jgi:hypothetical protein